MAILRPFNVFGPGQAERFLIPTIIGRLRRNLPVEVQDLEPRRDYLYVQDAIRAIRLALSSSVPFSLCNLGSGQSCSVAEVIQAVQDALGTHLPVHSAGARRKDEIMDAVADLTEAGRVFGWRPEWSFPEAIRATVAAVH